MRRPNLFIVGKPRSGTSALYYLLSQHPQIYMSPVKEPLHFCRDMIAQVHLYSKGRCYLPHRELENYLSLYRSAKDETVVGEACPLHAYSKVAAKEIYEFNSAAKIIMVFREPVSFLHSLHANETII